MAKVAFLGLGVMGFPMAGHLAKKGGHEVTVYIRTAQKAQAWVEGRGTMREELLGQHILVSLLDPKAPSEIL